MKRLERVATGADAAVTQALSRLFPDVEGRALRAALKARDVKINGRRASAAERVREGDVVTVFVPDSAVGNVPVVFEDSDYLVLDKPQGVETQGGDASAEAIAARHVGAPVFACHRLDAQTGGLLLLAKSPEALETARAAFASHALKKTYLCRVCGVPKPAQADCSAWLRKDAARAHVQIFDAPAPGALPIRMRYRVLADEGETALVEVELITGRTHQIRAHLAHLGYPILGDDKYGDRARNRALGVRRQQLWSVGLTLWDGRHLATQAPFAQKPLGTKDV